MIEHGELAKGEVEMRYRGIEVPFNPYALLSSLAITALPPATIWRIVEKVKDRCGSSCSETDIVRYVVDELTPYGVEERYLLWEEYRKGRREGKIEKPFIVMIGGVSATGKSPLAADLIGRFSFSRYISTDTVRLLLREFKPARVIWGHTWDADDDPVEGLVKQAEYVWEYGVKPFLDRAEREGAETLLEGVHLLPRYMRGENVVGIVVTAPEEVHRAYFVSKRRRGLLKDLGSEDLYEKVRRMNDFVVREARREGVRVVEYVDHEEAVRSVIDEVYRTLKRLVSSSGK